MSVRTFSLFLGMLFVLVSNLSVFAQTGTYQTLKSEEFFTKLDEERKSGTAVLLDVRTPDEYNEGNSPFAKNIDFYSPDFRNTIGKLDKNATYFLYCRSGNRSGQTLGIMKSMGFREVYDLAGGWSGNAKQLEAVK